MKIQTIIKLVFETPDLFLMLFFNTLLGFSLAAFMNLQGKTHRHSHFFPEAF